MSIDQRGASRDACVWLLLWLCLLPGLSAALDIDPRLARMHRFDSSLGLSQDSVLAMAQDRHGFMWFGTQDGLNRFDGYDVRTYRAERGAAGALHNSWIAALAIDAEGVLWAGSQAGLHRYDSAADGFERFAHAPGRKDSPAGDLIYALHADRDGRLWIGSDGGLSQWQPATRTFRNWQSLPGDAHGLPDNRVRALALDRDGLLWIGTVAGLARLDPRNGEFVALPAGQPLAAQPINALLVDRRGVVWIGSDQSGLLRHDPADGRWTQALPSTQPDGLPHARVHALLEDADGAIWVGSEAGASRVRDPAAATLAFDTLAHQRHDTRSLGAGRVPSLLQDTAGTLWIGTWESGASRLSPYYSRLHSFDAETPATAALRTPTARALAADGDALWIGTRDGIFHFDPASLALRTTATEGLEVFGMSLRGDALWVGSGAGLRRFDADSGQLAAPTLPDELNAARLRRVLDDGERLWLAAELLGLYVFGADPGQPLHRHRFAGNVYHMQPYDPQTLLVSASDGLHWYRRDGSAAIHHHPVDPAGSPGSLPAPPTGFARTPDGRLWLATYGGGLLAMQHQPGSDPATATFTDVTAGRGLANLGINDVLADDAGRLWLATDRGISRFDPADASVRNFDRSDGALVRGYYFASAARMDNGWLAFGSKDGFTVLDPARDDATLALPAPRLTELQRDNRAVPPRGRDPQSPLAAPLHALDGPLLLPAGWGRSLSLRFASPSFVAPERLRYAYRLDGFDEDWVETGADRRQATYTNLAPGRYAFHVVAIGPDGARSDVTRLELGIAPWWWQRGWAQLLGLILLVVLLAAAHQLRLRRIRAQKLGLERQVAERTEALAESRDRAEAALASLKSAQEELVQAEKLAALGQLVAGVAHEVNTPLGVALTASTHLHESIDQVSRQLAASTLRRDDLAAFIEQADEASLMIERNLERAADLVRNFKQVSVDRSSDGRRRFGLGEFFDELLQSLRLLWKHRPVRMRIDCPSGIELDSFPGALGQIVTNLAQNALLHAFAPDQPGQMTIIVRPLPGELVELRFADDGVGIPEVHRERIFDPFFTTRRSQGGTGLGLNIVFNLVVQKLGGTIHVDSRPGAGAEFVIVLPQRAP